MSQYHDTGLVALDLLNTWDEYLTAPERLASVEDLLRFCGEFDEDPPTGPDDLDAVRALRTRLRPVLTGAPAERTDALVELAAVLPIAASTTAVDGLPTTRIVAAPGADLTERLGVRAVRELLELAAGGHWSRLRRCAAAPCADAFVDRSKPALRQFCSRKCANRAHAAESRARKRT